MSGVQCKAADITQQTRLPTRPEGSRYQDGPGASGDAVRGVGVNKASKVRVLEWRSGNLRLPVVSQSVVPDAFPAHWFSLVRPTHRREPKRPHDWRTRQDPFESVWPELLVWLQGEPEATPKSLFQRLQATYPDQFPDGQLRTLQRRIRDWRQMMARKLVFSRTGEQACTVVGDGEQQNGQSAHKNSARGQS